MVRIRARDALRGYGKPVAGVPVLSGRGVHNGPLVDRISLGAWYPSAASDYNFPTLETQVGRSFDIYHRYITWTESTVAGNTALTTAAQSHEILATIMPKKYGGMTFDDIEAGVYDAWFTSWLAHFATLPNRVYLRFGHEMNLSTSQWNPGFVYSGTDNYLSSNCADAAQFVRVWQYLHGLMTAGGYGNISWFWCPNANDNPNSTGNHMEDFYPGDDYVDVVGYDAYNAIGITGWITAENTLLGNISSQTPAYTRVCALNATAPVWLGETGCRELTGYSKAQWYTDLAATTAGARIEAVVFFDQYNWVFDTTPEALAGFISAFGGTPQPSADEYRYSIDVSNLSETTGMSDADEYDYHVGTFGGMLTHTKLFTTTTIGTGETSWTVSSTGTLAHIYKTLGYYDAEAVVCFKSWTLASFNAWMSAIPSQVTSAHPLWVVWEQEANGASGGQVDPATYRSVYKQMDAARKAHTNGGKVKLLMNLMSYAEIDKPVAGYRWYNYYYDNVVGASGYNPGSSTGPNNYIDAFGWDVYADVYRINQFNHYQTMAEMFDPLVIIAGYLAATGVPWAVPEFGINPDYDPEPTGDSPNYLKLTAAIASTKPYFDGLGTLAPQWCNWWCSAGSVGTPVKFYHMDGNQPSQPGYIPPRQAAIDAWRGFMGRGPG